jgi:co-chaperonin GroES (HSP10)
MQITPLKNKVLVAENKSEHKSESGIILDGANSVSVSKTATVLAIGPDVVDVLVGDVVYLEWPKGQIVKIDDAQRVIIEDKYIVAVLEKDTTK